MGIGFGSGILLDLALFADRTNAEPESYLSIKWDIVYLRSRVARTTAMTGHVGATWGGSFWRV